MKVQCPDHEGKCKATIQESDSSEDKVMRVINMQINLTLITTDGDAKCFKCVQDVHVQVSLSMFNLFSSSKKAKMFNFADVPLASPTKYQFVDKILTVYHLTPAPLKIQ